MSGKRYWQKATVNRFAADELRLGELRQRNYIRLFIIYALIALISLARCLPISPSLFGCLLNSFRFVRLDSFLFCTLFCCWHLSESSAKNNIQVCLSQSRLGECDKNKGQKCWMLMLMAMAMMLNLFAAGYANDCHFFIFNRAQIHPQSARAEILSPLKCWFISDLTDTLPRPLAVSLSLFSLAGMCPALAKLYLQAKDASFVAGNKLAAVALDPLAGSLEMPHQSCLRLCPIPPPRL